MPDPKQFDPDRLRVALDHGEVVELGGGTLVLDGEESPSVVLRLAPWRARSVARVLHEWTSVSRIFHHTARPPARNCSCQGRWRWPLRCSVVAARSRSCGLLAVPALSPTGNAWPRRALSGERGDRRSAARSKGAFRTTMETHHLGAQLWDHPQGEPTGRNLCVIRSPGWCAAPQPL
jgi:hypothetical protein